MEEKFSEIESANLIGTPDTWNSFPPKEAEKRLEAYKLNRDLLLGRHDRVFRRPKIHEYSGELSKVLNSGYDMAESGTDSYVIANYAGLIPRIFASKLFGKPLSFRVGEDGSVEQTRLTRIIEDNTLSVTNIQQATQSSALGGAVYRIRYGRMKNWEVAGPIIEAVPPYNYFAHLSPDNVKDINGATLAFVFEYGDTKYLKTETHMPGVIRHELRNISEDMKIVPFDTVPYYSDLISSISGTPNTGLKNIIKQDDTIIEETGYPGLLVEYVPNFLLPDEYYGHGDLESLISLQGAINETNSGILRVVLKHIDPKLVLPPGTLQQDPVSGKWFVQKEDLEAIEVPDEIAGVVPRYVTWDAQLGAARANIDALFEAMMITSRVSLASFGTAKLGTADSGTAMRLKSTQTLDAVTEKRMYYDTALKNVLYAAMWLDVEYGGHDHNIQDISITWPDPMISDPMEETTMHVARVNASIESRRRAVKETQTLDGEALEDELDEIANDSAMDAPSFPGFGSALDSVGEDKADDDTATE